MYHWITGTVWHAMNAVTPLVQRTLITVSTATGNTAPNVPCAAAGVKKLSVVVASEAAAIVKNPSVPHASVHALTVKRIFASVV